MWGEAIFVGGFMNRIHRRICRRVATTAVAMTYLFLVLTAAKAPLPEAKANDHSTKCVSCVGQRNIEPPRFAKITL